MIDNAERSEISCSLDRPPKTTPTLILLTPLSPLGFALVHDRRLAGLPLIDGTGDLLGRAPPWRSIKTVVRRLLGDKDSMHMAFALTRRADPDEAGAAAKTGQISGADVAHPGLQAADQLLDV